VKGESRPVNSVSNFKLSPSALGLFLDCPRCFWLEKNRKLKRPRGIFPSLPGGMDRVIKTYFDGYRQDGGLPPEVQGKVLGRLFQDLARLNRWRDWKTTDLAYTDAALQVTLSGALDDCLIDGERYIPLDYKTHGYGAKPESIAFYQHQLDCYCLMLEASGFPTTGLAYLVYYYPLTVGPNGQVAFAVVPLRVTTDLTRAKDLVARAVTCLRGPLPAPGAECEHCQWQGAYQQQVR